MLRCPNCSQVVLDQGGKLVMAPSMQVKYRDAMVASRNALKYAKAGDCGLDLGYAPTARVKVTDVDSSKYIDFAPIRILPGTFQLVPTGVYVKIPDGHFGLLCGRSSTFGKLRLFVVETRIDSGYTGELFVKLWHPGVFGGNFEDPVRPAVIQPWQRVAQLVVIPYTAPTLEVVFRLPETERGATGFGSSGL